MAIAKQSAGVTIGYKPKVKRVEQRTPTLLQRTMVSLIANAREMREFAADELVYATLDTMRLLSYLKYEFGLAGVRRTTPVRRTMPDEGRTSPDGSVVALSADGI